MAAVLCLACGFFAWAGAWCLLGGKHLGGHAVAARAQSLMHYARRYLDAVAGAGVVELLLASELFSFAARGVSSRLEKVGVRFSTRESAALLLVAVPLACVLLGMFSRSFLVVVVALAAFVGIAQAKATSQRRRHKRELAQEMPGVLRTMATALESGNTLVQAIEYVGLHEKGHASGPFVRASLRLRCGMSIDDSLESLREELRAPGVDLMVTALSISQRTGSPLRSLLQRSAVLVEQQEEFERLLAVRTAQVRLSVRVVCSLPIVMVLLLLLISPEFQEGVLSPIGLASILIAVVMDGVALLLIRRIMGGVL